MAAHTFRPVNGLFLTFSEKDRVAEWSEYEYGTYQSVVGRAFAPALERLALLVPRNLSPNALSLAAVALVAQAWIFCALRAHSQPLLVGRAALAAAGAFWAFCAVAEANARSAKVNDSSLGVLFRSVCKLVGSALLIQLACALLLGHDPSAKWYCAEGVQTVVLMRHFSALMQGTQRRLAAIGHAELAVGAAGLAASWWLGPCAGQGQPGGRAGALGGAAPWALHCAAAQPKVLYWGVLVLSLCRLSWSRRRKEAQGRHGGTPGMLAVVLVLRCLAGAARAGPAEVAEHGSFGESLFMATAASDLLVANMAGRELHPWIVVMAIMTVLPAPAMLMPCLSAAYHGAVFIDLSYHLNIPVLQVVRNVYCDGIFDLCHIGHKNLFRRASKLGSHVKVGVIGDADANSYKRPPVMTAAEREREVRGCKGVSQIIQNAPFLVSAEFIAKHRLDVVCAGEEYFERFPNPDDDPYYRDARRLGIAVPMPRSWEMSTTDLIQRIQARGKDQKKSPT